MTDFDLSGYDIYSLDAINACLTYLHQQALRGVPIFWMAVRDLERDVQTRIREELTEYEVEEMTMRSEGRL